MMTDEYILKGLARALSLLKWQEHVLDYSNTRTYAYVWKIAVRHI